MFILLGYIDDFNVAKLKSFNWVQSMDWAQLLSNKSMDLFALANISLL